VVEEKVETNQHFERIIERARTEAPLEGVKLETHVMAGHRLLPLSTSPRRVNSTSWSSATWAYRAL
jgi:hypothetical protein